VFYELLYESYIKLAKEISKMCPGDFPKNTLFINSDAEAVENAIKIARKYTRKIDIISFEGAFHGRTSLITSLTTNCYRHAYGLERKTCNLRCAVRLEEIFTSVVDSENVAVIILESIHGESGLIIPQNEFITKIKNICDRYNILLITDKI